MKIRKTRTNFLTAVIGVIALVTIAIWQFYAFKDSTGAVDIQGGTLHLWLAIAVAVIACIAGVFVFSVFLRHDRSDELHITS